MLFLVDLELDLAGFPAGIPADLLAEAEESARAKVADGITLDIWRKANGRGVLVIWDVPNLDALYATIGALPAFAWMQVIDVTPLLLHHAYPQFGKVPADQRDAAVAFRR